MRGVQVVADSLMQVSLANNTNPSSNSVQPAQQGALLKVATDSLPRRQPQQWRRKVERVRDEKNAPSKASGGIPNATTEYIRLCSIPPQPLEEPKNLLVVIDLNGTLLYRPSRMDPTRFVMRPNAQLFLKYCLETFTVVIWSSAKPENVRAMCDTIFTPEFKNKAVAIWARDKFGLSRDDYNKRTQCYKRLTKLWGNSTIQASHPNYNMSGRWDHTNTVLIDDSIEKARSEPHNLIEVPEWSGDQYDQVLPQVHDYLNYLSIHSSVGSCLRARPWKPSLAGPSPPRAPMPQ